MKKVSIITDTTVQMPREIADAQNISLVPLHVVIDGKSYPENELNLDWFYDQMPEWDAAGNLPTTAAPSASDFLAAYRESSRNAEAVLYIGLSSKFSTALNTAIQARKMAGKDTRDVPFEIIDTLTVCGGQMLVTMEAARLAALSKGLGEIIGRSLDIVKRVKCVSLASDLSYLVRGGRIHNNRAMTGAKVRAMALLEADYDTGGVNRTLARYRTRERAIKALLDMVKSASDGRKLHMAINHAGVPEQAEELHVRLLSRFPDAEVCVSSILPVVTIHNGLGVIKLSWWDGG